MWINNITESILNITTDLFYILQAFWSTPKWSDTHTLVISTLKSHFSERNKGNNRIWSRFQGRASKIASTSCHLRKKWHDKVGPLTRFQSCQVNRIISRFSIISVMQKLQIEIEIYSLKKNMYWKKNNNRGAQSIRLAGKLNLARS